MYLYFPSLPVMCWTVFFVFFLFDYYINELLIFNGLVLNQRCKKRTFGFMDCQNIVEKKIKETQMLINTFSNQQATWWPWETQNVFLSEE